jgi:RHS repeat-associated protein
LLGFSDIPFLIAPGADHRECETKSRDQDNHPKLIHVFKYRSPDCVSVWWTWAQNALYDFAGRPTSVDYLAAPGAYTTRSFGYNVNSQLTSVQWSGSGTVSGTIQYGYSASQNNGQITQTIDGVSGETIMYQYDALRRLTSAASTPTVGSTPTAWTQTFQYDGFGNLTAKVLNGTTTPIAVNPATNQLSSSTIYDFNGNMTSGGGATLTYDVANRVASANEFSAMEYYYYAPDNKRIYRLNATTEEWTFYGARGERLGVYSLGVSGGFTPLRTNVSFAGTLILDLNNAAYSDRIGSNRGSGARFYPYGDEITSTGDDREKFGTYLRDHFTGFDYADQRYYGSSSGRFNTADPSNRNVRLRNPESWDMYSYSLGDPVNGFDPTGQCTFSECVSRGLQVAGGVVAIVGGTALVIASAGAEVGTGGLSTVGSAVGLIGGLGAIMSGAASIGAGLSGNRGLDGAATALSTITNPAGFVVTVGSGGNIETGAKAALLWDAGTLGAAAPLTLGTFLTTGIASDIILGAGTVADSLVNPTPVNNPDPVIIGMPISINVNAPAAPLELVPSPVTQDLDFSNQGSYSGTPTSGSFDVSGFEAAGFGGCGPAYCPNQN